MTADPAEATSSTNVKGEPVLPPRLSVVTLGARDIDNLRSFYERLGWHSPSPPGDHARFDVGGGILALYPLELLGEEAELPPRPDDGTFGGFTCAVVVEREELVDAAIASVRAAGGRILAEPVARAWGGRSGYFADPEGNAWEVAWLPGAEFDERGGLIWPG